MRRVYRVLVSLPLLIAVSEASSLDIYRDKSIYRYIPTDRYIGFVSNIEAECSGNKMATFSSSECGKDSYLCKEYKSISKLQKSLIESSYKIKRLNTILDRLSLNTLDAKKLIDATNTLSKEYANTKDRERIEILSLQQHKKRFDSITTSAYPLYLESDCKKELEIKMPSSYITAKFIQRASIIGGNTIEINRLISLKNRSGIDIVAKRANIHFQSYTKNGYIPHFSPWLLSPNRKMLYRANKKSLSPMPTAMPNITAYDSATIGDTTKKGFRDYSISGLVLPSDGKEYEQKIYTEKVPVECQETAYSYISSTVYNICSFKSSTPIEDNRWEIITPTGSKIYTEGRYESGKYLLNVGIDESITLRRERIPSKDRKSGFFGSDIKRTDGYTITLTNRTKESKNLTIIDRIPYSKSDKIRVTLDSVTGADSKKLGKYGKLTLKINLKAMQSRTIRVLFSLRYDKKLHINY